MRQVLLVVMGGLVLLTGCAGGSISGLNQTEAAQSGPSGARLAGTVRGGQQPIVGARVYLLAANTANMFNSDNPATPVANGQTSVPVLNYALVGNVGDTIGPYVTTDANGNFSLTGLYSCTPGTQVYLYSQGGAPGGAGNSSWAALMAVLGTCPATGDFSGSIPFISVNEVSTIAAAYAMADFATDPTHVWSTGTLPAQSGVANAFANAANLANLGTGAALTSSAPQTEINSLANILAACVNSNSFQSSSCSILFDNAQPTGSNPVYPTNTAMAAVNIAHNPTANIAALFSAASSSPPFEPSLTSQPVDFTIPLVATPTPAPYFKNSLNTTAVFMGDSITQYWNLPINNAGVAGAFTADMLARFQTDVINPGYARVVILGGTNDIWLSPSPNIPQAVANVEAMAQMATNAGMEVVLCTLPANETNQSFFAQPPLYPAFNQAITAYAAANNYPLVDYYSLTVNHPEYYIDGVHPNPAGYAVMEAALSAVVTQ
jgi:lysophospholipase L1-like esterase